MKKLFTLMAVCLCGTMVYAQTSAISAKDVTIAKGGSSQMEVVIDNATSNTAFQFDLKLPAKVSVKEAKMKGTYGESRVLLNQQVDEANNIYRFLSYDNANAVLTSDGNGVIITLEAGADAVDGTATLNGEDQNLVVNPAGESTAQAAGNLASIKVAESVQFTIGAKKVTTLVSDKDLDFSNSDVNAYIATGYDYTTNNIILTRVKDVPKNTPILLMGEPSGETPYVVPVSTSKTYYPENFLKGNATAAAPVDNSGDYINMRLKDGEFIALTAETVQAGKGYLQVPAASKVSSATGDALSFTMGTNGTKSYTGKYDLDFEDVDDLSAYVVTGYDKDNTVWLTRVKKASAKTPLVLLGKASKDFVVPSSEQKTSYVNMLRGDAENAITINKTEGEWTNLILKSGQYVGLSGASMEIKAGTSYLPIPTSIIVASRGELANNQQYKMVEAEVITMHAIIGNEATGISRIATEVDNDVWYNLNGQRIDTPTRKGLYIKNGKKVIVK